MDLFLRGRGASNGVRAPLWYMRLAGAVLGYATLAMADRLGFSAALGLPSLFGRFGALIVGAFIAPTVLGAMLWATAGLLVAASLLIAFTPIVQAPARFFVRNDAASSANHAAETPIDAVVILSGSTSEDGRLAGQALDRFVSAMKVARARHVPEIALSVVESVRGSRHFDTEADQRALLALMAPELTPHFVHKVKSTRDEALRFAALADTSGWHHVAVVTSPMHSRRACRTFEVVGLSVECIVAESRDYSLVHLEGAGARMDVFHDLLYESLATMLYKVRGWI